MSSVKINELFKKNPSILKALNSYSETISDYKLLHLHHVIKTNTIILKKVKLVYSQYKTFQDLYSAIMQVTGQINNNESQYFNSSLFLNKLNENKVSYIEAKKGIIIVKIDNYEQVKEYGSDKWCIVKSKKMFDNYTKNGRRDQYILFDFDNKNNANFKIGFTYSEEYFIAFDNNDQYVNSKSVNELLPLGNKFNIKDIVNIEEKTISLGEASLEEWLIFLGLIALGLAGVVRSFS